MLGFEEDPLPDFPTDNLAEIENLLNALAEEVIEQADRSMRSVLQREGAYAFAEVHMVSAPVMAKLNAEQREIDEPTDVLSFPLLEMHDGVLLEEPEFIDFITFEGVRYLQLGEIIICTDVLLEQAERFGHSAVREGSFLFVHGLLHLMGYDHEDDELAERQMTILQENVLENLGLSRDVLTLPAFSQAEFPPLEAEPVAGDFDEDFRAGFVAIVGRPNIGKSTLLNHLMDYPLAITSRKAQTTRRDIRGVLNRPQSQIILIDTPGIAKSETRLEEAMARTQSAAVQDADLLLFLVDARFPEPGPPERRLLQRIKDMDVPTMLLINKIDLVAKEEILPLIAQYAELYDFREILPLSALKEDGTDQLLDLIEENLPVHPPYYEEEVFTDQSERLLAAEWIRKQILENFHDELPYAMAVKIDEFTEIFGDDSERELCEIWATIYCETESQKRILYGKNFKAFELLRTRSAESLQELLGCPVELDLHVKVRKDWRRRPSDLRDLGLESGSSDGLVPLS